MATNGKRKKERWQRNEDRERGKRHRAHTSAETVDSTTQTQQHAHKRSNHGHKHHSTHTNAETTDKTTPETNAKHKIAHGLGNVLRDLQKFQFIFWVDAGVGF